MDIFIVEHSETRDMAHRHFIYLKNHAGQILMNVANRLQNKSSQQSDTVKIAINCGEQTEVFNVYIEDIGELPTRSGKAPDFKIDNENFPVKNALDPYERVLHGLFTIGRVMYDCTHGWISRSPNAAEKSRINAAYANFGEDGVPDIYDEKTERAALTLKLFLYISLDTSLGIFEKSNQVQAEKNEVRRKLLILNQKLEAYYSQRQARIEAEARLAQPVQAHLSEIPPVSMISSQEGEEVVSPPVSIQPAEKLRESLPSLDQLSDFGELQEEEDDLFLEEDEAVLEENDPLLAEAEARVRLAEFTLSDFQKKALEAKKYFDTMPKGTPERLRNLPPLKERHGERLERSQIDINNAIQRELEKDHAKQEQGQRWAALESKVEDSETNLQQATQELGQLRQLCQIEQDCEQLVHAIENNELNQADIATRTGEQLTVLDNWINQQHIPDIIKTKINHIVVQYQGRFEDKYITVKQIQFRLARQSQTTEVSNNDGSSSTTSASSVSDNNIIPPTEQSAARSGFFQAPTIHSAQDAFTAFKRAHTERLGEDKRKWGCFGFLRKTTIDEGVTLEFAIKHAINHPSCRSRQVLEELKWLTPEGKLGSNAPASVEEIYDGIKNPAVNSSVQH